MELSKYKIYIVAGLTLLIGAGAGFFVAYRIYSMHKQQILSQITPLRSKDSSYKFINPLLGYDLPESTEFGEYTELTKKLNDLIGREQANGKAQDVSIYFRGGQGRWVGINDSEGYYPASLLKVVVMIAYFQQAENDPGILQKELQFTSKIQNEAISSEFSAPSSLTLNGSYTVDDLIKDMIMESDNGATYTLLDSLDGKAVDEVYGDLGLQSPDNANYEISAKDYSLFFRILYNATYLNREYSERALSLLSQTTFKDGLEGGLPAGTIVAHKYGEHVLTDSSGNTTGLELHDCGIVYNPTFLLCVMTRGQKLNDLEQTIRDVASLVYNEAKNNPN